MLRCNWNDVELEERYGGKGFWHDRQVVFTKPYNNYMVEVSLIRDFHDNGTASKYWSIHLNRYNDKYGWAEETYCLDVIFTITELWQYVAGLELEVTVSDFQYLESLELFQELVRGAFGNEAELEGIDTKTGDLWLFIPIDKHHVEAWQKVYLGEGRYENSFQYMESINWDKMTPLERYKILGWRY
jgi:hypothetical protein